METFDWMQFPEGRARFSGGVRGAEQLGHETFAVEFKGVEYFGEVEKRWLDDEHFNVGIVSFGHHMLENIGMPMDPASPFIAKFSNAEVPVIQALITALVQAFATRKDGPSVMSMRDESQFLGKVLFSDHWVLRGGERRGSP